MASVVAVMMISFVILFLHWFNRKVAHLGSGEFGSVDRGQWTSERGVMEVAVKTLTDSANTVKFLQEAAIMAQFKHPNVIALRGVVSDGISVSVIIHHSLAHNNLVNTHKVYSVFAIKILSEQNMYKLQNWYTMWSCFHTLMVVKNK